MLRKLIIFGVFAGASASIPMLYEKNSAAIGALVRPKVQDDKAQPSAMAPNAKVAFSAPSARKVTVDADARGHFSASFRLNGRQIDAMIDTGASVVAINLSTARRIGVQVGNADFVHDVSTANGTVKAAIANIDRLQIGRIEVENVQAMVLQDKALSGTLIGMSFLSRLARYQVEGGALLMVQ